MACPLRDCVSKFLAAPNAARIVLAVSAASLLFAFISQYGFGYDPCILCLWQRVPFAAALVLAGLASLRRFQTYAPLLLGLCAFAFLVGAGLAVFHTGVERHWWLGTRGCTIQPLSGASVEDLRMSLLSTPTAHCDQISWTLFGLSMANYNIVLSLALALFSACAARRAGK